jgi:hypothetical protein
MAFYRKLVEFQPLPQPNTPEEATEQGSRRRCRYRKVA